MADSPADATQPQNCQQCGNQFTTSRADDTACAQCKFYLDRPEMPPQTFTWTQVESQWFIRALRPIHLPRPRASAVVTVHRRNGTGSPQTIDEIVERTPLKSGDIIYRCSVRPNST